MPATDGAHDLTRLDGGVRVITASMRERASVAVAFMVGAGSRDERDQEAGLAHFIEHMVFKGTRRYPTARHLSEAIEGVGGVLNAATDKEMTMFWAKVPQGQLELAVDVLSDMVVGAGFDPVELVKERSVVIEELRMYQDNPQDHVGTLFDEMLWPDHPLGLDTAGREETVRGFSRDDCLRFCAEHYLSDRVVVTATGAIAPDEVVTLVQARLGGLGDGNAPQARAATPIAAHTPRLRLVNRRTEQANICLGARARSYADPDRYVVDVLTTVLGDGMSSRLFLALREERGLAYDVHAFGIKHRDSGALGIYLGCEPRQARAAVAAAVAELHRLANELVDEAELRKAKSFMAGRLRLQLEGTSSLCTYLGQQELLCDEVLTAEDVIAGVEAVSAADVCRLAGEICADGLRGAVIGPFRSEQGFLQEMA